MNLKRVRANNLINSARTGVSEQQRQSLEDNRNKCALMRLFASQDRSEVRRYVDVLKDCLKKEGIFPPPREKVDEHVYEQTDVDMTQGVVDAATSTGDLVVMKAILMVGLRVSKQFVQVFCPLPSPTMDRRFLVNPEVMALFVDHPRLGLIRLISLFLQGRHASPAHFVSICFTTWEEFGPWIGYEQWGTASTNQPSAEIAEVRKRLRMTADADAREHAMLEAGAGEQGLIDY